MKTQKKQLSLKQVESLLKTLKGRFENHKHRHMSVDWSKVEARLKSNPNKLWSLHEMERTGGEPDVVTIGKTLKEFLFVDCSEESPKARRSLCYDRQALDARRTHKPKGSGVEMAESMGVELLSEQQYRDLQQLGEFDLKTSSWLLTPPRIRKLGGAIFGDRRYDTVFVSHNGAESYYASRGFRAGLRV